jgi:hypothetical protein
MLLPRPPRLPDSNICTFQTATEVLEAAEGIAFGGLRPVLSVENTPVAGYCDAI